MSSQIENTKKQLVPNYSILDKEIFLSIFNKYKHIIECKQTDAKSSRQKNKTWSKVVDLYNSNVSQKRNVEQLQQLWRNLKKKGKRAREFET